MNANMCPRVAGILCVIGWSLVSGPALVATQAQAVPAPALDEALRADDLQKARLIVPEDWAAAERLLLLYLDRAFIAPDSKERQAEARTLAGRLAEVFFRIVEYPFAGSLVTRLDSADATTRAQLMGVTEDYFTALERLRRTHAPLETTGPSSSARSAERQILSKQFVDIADRFQVLGLPQGELFALRTMINLPDSTSALARADRLAADLGDELALVGRRPYTEASLAMAVRLGLPTRICAIVESLTSGVAGWTDRRQLEQAGTYLEQCRATRRQVPVLETFHYWLFPNRAPRNALTILPRLWTVHQKLQRPEAAQEVLTEAIELSQPFGEPALRATLSAFAAAAARFEWDAAAPILAAGMAAGPLAAFDVLKGMAGRVGPAERTPDRVNRVLALYDDVVRSLLASGESGVAADAMSEQAVLQIEAGQVAEAAMTFERAVDCAEQNDDYQHAAAIANRAAAQGSRSLPPPSRSSFAERAIAAATRADAPGELAKALRTRGLSGVGASHQSFEDLRSALAAAERHTATSGDFGVESSAAQTLAAEHVMRGEYRAAVAVLERAADRSTLYPVAGPTPGRAVFDRQLVSVHMAFGEPALALIAAERARTSLERDAPPTVSDHASLAELYRTLRQPAAALENYARAYEAHTIPNSLPGGQAGFLQRWAGYLTELGDYEAAARFLNDARAQWPVLQQDDQQRLRRARWSADMARVHYLAGDDAKALSLAREAVADLRDMSAEVWIGLHQVDWLTAILLDAHATDEAGAFCTDYFQKMLTRPVDQPALQKAFLEVMARVDLRAGRIGDARSRLLSAAEIDRAHPTFEIGGLAGSLLALGRLELEAGNDTAAREHLTSARSAAQPYDQERIWQIERALAVAAVRSGRPGDADLHYRNALTALESVPEHLRPEEFRLQFGETPETIYDEHAGLLAERALASGSQDDAERAFQAAERKRARVLWDLLAEGWSRLPSEAMPDQLRRRLDLEARMSAKRALLREQGSRLPGDRDSALVEVLDADLRQLQSEYAGLLTSFAQGQYRYTAPTDLAVPLAGPVRAALGPARVLLEYLVLEDHSYAFAVSPAGITVVPIAVGRAELRERVHRLLQPFQQLRNGQVDLARLGYDTGAAWELHEAIVAPLRSSLGSATEILIVPDDVLNLLPFEALVDRMPRATTVGSSVLHGGYADEAFLIRRYAIGYLASSAQLLDRAAETAPADSSKRLFAMANPAAGQDAPAPVQDDPLKRQLRSARFETLFRPLPGSEVEVVRIAGHVGLDVATVVLGRNATESAYLAQAGQYDIVHFATHAVASDAQPLYSTLLLAADGTADHDGFLQAYEVLGTPLRARLVVLSGCETAVGSEDWGQGLVGLAAAFEQAGAGSVLATLWSIDESAVEVMDAFYREMSAGRSTAAALRQAKLDLLERRISLGGVEVSLAHPFFWAPFKLVGGGPWVPSDSGPHQGRR